MDRLAVITKHRNSGGSLANSSKMQGRDLSGHTGERPSRKWWSTYDDGGNKELSRWFFDNLIAQGVKFDVIGVSFYPWWHGTIAELKDNLAFCVSEFDKEVDVVETSDPWTLQWYEWDNKLVGSETQLQQGYPATKAGQAAFLHDGKMVVAGLPNQRGLGVIYWAATWVTSAGWGLTNENQALFDEWGYPTPALDVLKTARNIFAW